MVSAIISRVVILLFGTLYPAYASYKAVKTKNVKEYVKWMMYWIVFAFFTCMETFADIFLAWLPFYYEMKILFVLWLLSPATKGASILYRKFLHPQLAKREKEIDTYIAKASDQGYTALLNLGSKGFNYATNVVLTTAMKGQTKIADHLRKSYSMSDLSGDPQRKFQREESEDIDDETDNRLIEESYLEEMNEKERSRRIRAAADEEEEEYEEREREKEERPRRRKVNLSKEDPGLYRLDETEEEAMARTGRKSYSHKEALNACSVLSKSAATKKSSSMMNVPADYKVKGLASESGYVSKITSQYSQNVSDDAEVTRSASSWRSRTSYSYKWK